MARCRVYRSVLLLLTRLLPSPPPASSPGSLGAALISTTSPLFSSSPLTSRFPVLPSQTSLPRLPLLPAPAPAVGASRSSSGRPPTAGQWSLLLLTSSPASAIIASSADSAWGDFCLERTWRSGSHPPHLSLRTSLLSSLAAAPSFSYLAMGGRWFSLTPS